MRKTSLIQFLTLSVFLVLANLVTLTHIHGPSRDHAQRECSICDGAHNLTGIHDSLDFEFEKPLTLYVMIPPFEPQAQDYHGPVMARGPPQITN